LNMTQEIPDFQKVTRFGSIPHIFTESISLQLPAPF
jgi:hypothetical protein